MVNPIKVTELPVTEIYDETTDGIVVQGGRAKRFRGFVGLEQVSAIRTEIEAVAGVAEHIPEISDPEVLAAIEAAPQAAEDAEKWASEDEDVEVTPGLFSARHYWLKILALAISAADFVKAIGQVNLTGGYTIAPTDYGDLSDGPIQLNPVGTGLTNAGIINIDGSGTINAPDAAGACSMMIELVGVTGAGSVTWGAGFDKVIGTTPGDGGKAILYVNKVGTSVTAIIDTVA